MTQAASWEAAHPLHPQSWMCTLVMHDMVHWISIVQNWGVMVCTMGLGSSGIFAEYSMNIP